MRILTRAVVTALGVTVLVGILAAPNGTWPSKQPHRGRTPLGVLSLSDASPLPANARAGVLPGYHYGAAYTQRLSTASRGLHATLSVHRPGQVRGSKGQHSVGQIAVGTTHNRSFVEAGWRRFTDGPRLFVYWRPKSGGNTCYNTGCGFKLRGPGKKPGSLLKPGSTITVGFKHSHHKWWFFVNGKRSGFYPDKLWHGHFTKSNYSQVYGEVFVPKKQRLCADMGNGKRPSDDGAASISDVAFYGGPPVQLTESPYNDTKHYGVVLTSPNALRYGGPGAC